MTQLPNIITLLRIAGSMGLLFCNVTGVVFWIIYGLCGISDIVDGWLARKLKCVTKTGALLDSLADICFVACYYPLYLRNSSTSIIEIELRLHVNLRRFVTVRDSFRQAT